MVSGALKGRLDNLQLFYLGHHLISRKPEEPILRGFAAENT
jgi:hypothetical protein